MKSTNKNGGSRATGSAPYVAALLSTASLLYPFAGIGSTEFAARRIGVRHRLSPVMARTVVELLGLGGGA